MVYRLRVFVLVSARNERVSVRQTNDRVYNKKEIAERKVEKNQ